MSATEPSVSVVLVSGGIDSTTTLALARNRGDRLFALSFDYGQRHKVELVAAKAIARSIGVERHIVQTIDLRQMGGSALTSDAVAVPYDRNFASTNTIPVTYVPARNLIFLSVALGWAEVLGVGQILIGANAVDYSGYPDCRPEFLKSFEETARLATRVGAEGFPVRIEAPLLNMSKADIIRTGVGLGVDYSLTLSCYDPDPEARACGRCDSCQIRRRGFTEAGIADPTRYIPSNHP
jgi:7-cyano-7-deazaguanine synthase